MKKTKFFAFQARAWHHFLNLLLYLLHRRLSLATPVPPRTLTRNTTHPREMSSALCRTSVRPAPLARANKAAGAPSALAAPRSSSSTPASLKCRAAPSVDVGSDWPANWALASFEDVGEYFNTKLLKVEKTRREKRERERGERSEASEGIGRRKTRARSACSPRAALNECRV